MMMMNRVHRGNWAGSFIMILVSFANPVGHASPKKFPPLLRSFCPIQIVLFAEDLAYFSMMMSGEFRNGEFREYLIPITQSKMKMNKNYCNLCEDDDIWGYDEHFDVQKFLEYLKSPRCKDMPEFARYIDDAAKQNNINQRILLAIAQKEQSFLTRPSNSQGWERACNWVMGYGATDSGDIPKYKGLKNQIYSAAAGLRRYLDSHILDSMVGRPLSDSLGKSIDANLGQIVPSNLATAALYLYTPHLGGADLFISVWNKLTSVEASMTKSMPYPSPLTSIDIYIKLLNDENEAELLGKGVYDGNFVKVAIRFLEVLSKWIREHVQGSYQCSIKDALREENRVYILIKEDELCKEAN